MNSRVILSKNIKMDREYVNVLSYSESEMVALCLQNKVIESSNFSFIRANKSIQVPFSYGECLQANYIAFQNPDYSNKWFFAWIDEVIYKGDSNTEIKYTIDSWSTWFDKWTKKPCFIQREHTNDDRIGANTLPENLDVGNVIQEDITIADLLGSEYYFIVSTTYTPVGDVDFVGVNKVNGILHGTKLYAFEPSSVWLVYLETFLQATNADGKISAIDALYIAPKNLIDAIGKEEVSGEYLGAVYKYYKIRESNESVTSIVDINVPKSFNGINIKNNKCFTYPFNYLLVTNNVGNQNIYKYEEFGDSGITVDTILFTIEMALTIGCSVRLVPNGYKNIESNYDESIPLAKFPTCSWATDAFVNWITNNAINIGTQVLATGAGIATGNVKTVAGNIASLIGQFYQASLLPSIQGGNNSGDVNFASKQNVFKFINMRVKNENLKVIDDYFSRFGYSTNRVKEPNITGRQNFNYIEIGQSEEIGYGEVPASFMNDINNACRRGVTIWHNHNNLGNYNIENNII